MEFLEYAYLQIGEDDKAKEMVEAQAGVAYDQVDSNLHDYVNRTRANSPALYYLETRDWKAAEALRPDPSAEVYNQSITYWAQAVAAGHLRDLSAAQHAVDEYDAMLEATKNGPRPGIAKQMTTRHDEAHAWLLFLQGKYEEAVELLGKLANKQDVDGKGEVETPAREMLADMLLEMNRFSEALAAYERSMNIDPNRFNGLYGVGRAAEFLGEADKARDYYGHLLGNCSMGSQRLELIHARGIVLATRGLD